MGLPKFEKQEIIVVYNNFEYRRIDFKSFEINFSEGRFFFEKNENEPLKELIINTSDFMIDSYNFDDIDLVIIDNYFLTEIKLRKKLTVKFVGYQEFSGMTTSLIKLRFTILDFEIEQDESLQSIKSLIRDLKLKKLGE